MGSGFLRIFDEFTDPNPSLLEENEFLGEDGLKYCTLCHEHKNVRVTICGFEKIVACQCRCDTERKKQEDISAKENSLKINFRSNQRDIAGEYFKSWFFENSQAKLEWAHRYVEGFDKYLAENVGLLLIGGKGTGKSVAAACIANELVRRGYSVMMDSVSNYKDAISAFDNADIKKKIAKADLMVIDDLGTERDTAYMREAIHSLIEARYLSRKPLIVTSNITMDEFKSDKTENFRIYDRLKQMCHPIALTGESWRIKVANERYNAIKKELGR